MHCHKAENRTENVDDGIVEPTIYFSRTNTPKRLLFLLKEANDPNGGGWDLKEFLRMGARWQTWNNITRWAMVLGALNATTTKNVYVDDVLRKEVLSHIAVVNLKKKPGGSTSDAHEIRRAALENANLVRHQIAECEPDMIVCCGSGVADGLEDVLAGEDLCWRSALSHRMGKHGDTIIIDFWHPAARKNKIAMVQEIEGMMRIAHERNCA